MSGNELDSQVETLKREGRYAEAAEVCEHAGELLRAAELYATVWAWNRAIELATQAERLDVAYRHAVDSDDPRMIEHLIATLADMPEQTDAAARIAESKGRNTDAAHFREIGGDAEAAAELYERAGELFDAARVHETNGAYRRAGRLYERRLQQAPDDAEASLRLGRILAHFGRYEHAIRALQNAASDHERQGGALRLMVACFDALGMEEAAGHCLDRLRRDDPALPVSVPEFLSESFGDERGLAAAAHEDEDVQLLAGRYRVQRPLGAGATGRVLLAHDSFYSRHVALKLLTVGAGERGRDAYVRFAREARVAAGLEHPNVVHVHEYNPAGPFLVMEYMSGGTLADRLAASGEDRPLPLPVAQQVLVSVLRGLEAVHRRGVVHRDLKPDNVFFGPAGDVKIGDFGVAHLADLGATITGAMIGTLAYMAPEQMTGERRPEAATDLYALGVLMFQMITGRLPFGGPDLVTQHLEQPAPTASEARPELGDAYDAILDSLLAKSPEARPRSAAEVRQALEALPWHDPSGTETRDVAPTSPVAERSAHRSSPPPSRPSTRYVRLGSLPRDAWRARDTVLDRIVHVVPCNPRRAARLASIARCDSPYLQAVYALQPDHQRAIIESPSGVPLPQAHIDEAGLRATRAQVRLALERMHARGVVHGEVSRERVLIAPGRAVLLLPDDGATATPADDLAAAAQL